jgi:hypothetical protein
MTLGKLLTLLFTALLIITPQAYAQHHCNNDYPLQSEAKSTRGTIDIPWIEWIPAVMPFDRSTLVPVTITARILGGASSARLTLSNAGGTINLFDNGAPPDFTAGDGIFSASVPVQSVLDRNTPERVHRPFMGRLQALDGAVLSGPMINTFLPVMPAEARSIPVTTLASTARSTPWLLNIRDDAFSSDFNLERVITTALTRVPDAYEFVHVVYGPQNFVQNRFHGRIRSNIQGIGLPIINASASYGNSAKLLGFTAFPSLSFYDMQGPGLLHETGHQWINALPGIFADASGGAHWPIASMTNNVMGWSLSGGAGGDLSCSLSSNGVSLTTSAQASQIFSYNNFELYLMGMVPSIANGFVVNDQTAIRNIIANNLNWCNGSSYSLATTAFNQATLTTAAGVRVPGSASAPKYFRVLTLVASSGRTLGDDELRYISFMTARAQNPGTRLWAEGLGSGSGGTFFEATGERARLDFRLDGTFASGFEGN